MADVRIFKVSVVPVVAAPEKPEPEMKVSTECCEDNGHSYLVSTTWGEYLVNNVGSIEQDEDFMRFFTEEGTIIALFKMGDIESVLNVGYAFPVEDDDFCPEDSDDEEGCEFLGEDGNCQCPCC